MRSISRVADVSINTVTKLLVDAGEACAEIHDEMVRGVEAKRVQCDEIWSFCYAKRRNVETAKAAPLGAGDVWTWTALDSDSKLILSWYCGDRSAKSANTLMGDLRDRVSNRIQLTTDGYGVYAQAIERAFGREVDYAQLVKLYGDSPDAGRYSPGQCMGALKERVVGNPKAKDVNTSHVERQNLTMRMSMRRFTRLTNGFSKKLDNHMHALALYFVFYNFCRIHTTLKVTPAMEAGITEHLWTLEEVAGWIEERQPASKRGPYKKHADEISN